MKGQFILLAVLAPLLSAVVATPEAEAEALEARDAAPQPEEDLIACPDGQCGGSIRAICPRIRCFPPQVLYYNPKTKICKCTDCRLILCPFPKKPRYDKVSKTCRCELPYKSTEKRSIEVAPEDLEKREVIPPCSNIRCASGIPYYNPIKKTCVCRPRCEEFYCPPEKPQPWYNPITNKCACRKKPYYLEKREAEAVPEPEPVAEPEPEPEAEAAPEPEANPQGTFPEQCIAVTCPINTNVIFNEKTQQCECIPIEPISPCALILCAPNTVPVVDPVTKQCKCVPPKPKPCPKNMCPYSHTVYWDAKTKSCKCRRTGGPY